jgi:hypothetical protein
MPKSFFLPVAALIIFTGPSGSAAFSDGSLQTNTSGSIQNGKVLFAGTMRFQNGGPPCAACHAISGLPFPNGGTLGPDLSKASARLGPKGMAAALQTLFFPTMAPIFDARPITVSEQNDLEAFLDQAQSGPTPPNITPIMASVGAIGLLALLAAAWGIWRKRLRGVRRTLVHSAGGVKR